MKNGMVSRRKFVKITSALGLGAALAPSFLSNLLAQVADKPEGICITLCNHWSYIGIGWQLGIESCVLSAVDAMGMADLAPHVKTCLELDARAYEFMAEKFPEVAERLKRYLAEDKVELIGGTYSQPMGTMFSGESNIRQLVYGRETIRKALNYEVATFLDEEEFSHPQIPQIAAGAGYRYSSLAQVDTWGRAGIPYLEVNAFRWKGMDGTTILSTPKNSLFGFSPDLVKLATSDSFKRLQALGKPLLFTWEEFGWEPPEEPSYLKTSEKYQQIAGQLPVEFVTLKDYLDRHGSSAAPEPVYFRMDDWNKLLTWGLGGDQLRIMDRKVEGTLQAAERFDAVAAGLGAKSHARSLDKAWKNFLTAQSHDVGLCEYSRWQGDRMAPLDRLEDHHNFTWGALGYSHLDAAEEQGQEAITSSVGYIASRINSQPNQQGQLAIAVFNPSAWVRTDLATTGRLYPIRENAKDIVVRDHSGHLVPSQIIKSDKDNQGNLRVADVAFLAEKVPSVGYDTYYLDFLPQAASPATTDLRIDEHQLTLENEFVKVKLSPNFGAIISLFDKRTGNEMLAGDKCAFPVFRGTPNQDYGLLGVFVQQKYHRSELKIPAPFDSSKSKAAYEGTEKPAPAPGETDWRAMVNSSIRWIEKGPLRATVKTHHEWPLLKFESYVTLCAGLPSVEVTCRVLAQIPPAPDALDAENRFPADIQNGYWLSFAPAFSPTSVIRDFPLGIEPSARQTFQGRTFVDLVGPDTGLLVLHPGTQYFRREADGIFSNLLMREWESYFTGEYGWPRYSEYHHALVPHDGSITNSDRVRAAEAFSQNLITVVGKPLSGSLPPHQSFVQVEPKNLQVLAFRKKEGPGFEIRAGEVEGKQGPATIRIEAPVGSACETNLLGKKIANAACQAGKLNFESKPWKVQTFEVL
ncbi:MAG TPA: glycoside hydrolase family 38 C-terminal domain-containing protein [Terriglobia bacterium]|nr:glycoside hydrolase family 38 C-terminal domain-containing protein [Terriglobia bacterium]